MTEHHQTSTARERELEIEVARLTAELETLQGEDATAATSRFLAMAAATVDQAVEDARREADEIVEEVSAQAEAMAEQLLADTDRAQETIDEANAEAEEIKAAAASDAENLVQIEREKVAGEIEALAEVRGALEDERDSLETYHEELRRRVQELAESMVSFMTTEPPLGASAAIDNLVAPQLEAVLELTRVVGWVESLLGYTPTEWRDLPVSRRVHPDDLAAYRLDAASVGEADVREVRLRCADGSNLRVREVVRQMAVGDRRYFRGVILDIAEEAAVREEVDRLAAVVANQSEPLLVVAGREAAAIEPRVLQMNPAFAALAGIDAAEGGGRLLADVAPWLPASVRADLDDVLDSGRVADRDDVEIATPTGVRTFDYELVVLPDGAVGVQFADVTDRKHATELIRHQAFHDPLTSLPNRSLLFDRLTQALAGLRRDGTTVGLLPLDLNQFKEINDTRGHGYGDELLTTVGVRLSDMMREVDTVARLGGDEFAIVLNGASEADLQEISGRVADAVKAPVRLEGIEVEVTASIGGAVAPTHGTDAHTLLQRSDIAMYDAKRSGTPYRLYVPDDDRHSLDRLTLMGELRHLLDGGLRVWFQPKVDLRTGRVHEMEALARWQHKRLGLVGPGQFIGLCEVSGLVADLTFAVLDQALDTIKDWPDQRVAVNVPVRNLYDRRLPDAVMDKLNAAGIAPDRLILEITEREIMEDHRAIVDVLGALHEQGVRISIDDFGTGFSSLTHLRRLPLHEIKIDQSFISGMLDRENDYIIARSIIDLAYNLGHRVVAEGVEDTATLALLRGLGCDIAQGFLFARPGPSERLRRQIESGPALDDEGILARGNA
jgi:diguanylate cyclase (GGDEF)-like protein/PAS domain S-box-containing protein